MKFIFLSILFSLIWIPVALSADTQIYVHLKTKPYNLNASHELSAVGFVWIGSHHDVRYVDPNSDVFGKVMIGDIFISEDGLSPEELQRSGQYLNNDNVPANCTFSRNGYVFTITAYRHPVRSFGATWWAWNQRSSRPVF